jgi:hypothetical protein
VAAAAVTAGGLSNLGRFNHPSTFLLASSVVLWIATLGIFAAVAGGMGSTKRSMGAPHYDLQLASEQAREDAAAARRVLGWALVLTLAAVCTTIAAVVVAAVDSERDDNRSTMELWLTPAGAQAVAKLCRSEQAYRRIRGTVASSDLAKPAVPLHIDDRTLTLPSAAILGAVKIPFRRASRPDCE